MPGADGGTANFEPLAHYLSSYGLRSLRIRMPALIKGVKRLEDYVCKVVKRARVQVEGLRLPQAVALRLRILSFWRLPLQLLALLKAPLPPSPSLRWVVDSAHREGFGASSRHQLC